MNDSFQPHWLVTDLHLDSGAVEGKFELFHDEFCRGARNMRSLTAALIAALLIPTAAHAYIGPGMGAGAIAAVLGVVAAVLLALFSVIYYPVKRAMKKRNANGQASSQKDAAAKSSSS